MTHFHQFVKETDDVVFLSEINTQMIDRYKAYRKNGKVHNNGSPSISKDNSPDKPHKAARAHTINFEMDTLRLMFNQAIKWDYIKINPVLKITRLKVDDAKPPRFLTTEECTKLLNACPTELRQIYFTFLNTGMRKSELEYLQWRDIDLKRRMIMIRHKENWHPKSGERDIPINDSLYEMLKEIHRNRKKDTAHQKTLSRKGPRDKTHHTSDAAHRSPDDDYVFNVINSGHSRNWLREQLIKIGKEAGIENLTKLHTLRHTFASHLVMNGVDLPTVKKLMGHSDIQTTMIYAHLAPDHLAGAVDKLEF